MGFARFGLPFIVFMVGGTQALSYLIGGRYQLRDEVDKQKQLLLTNDEVCLPKRAPDLSASDVVVAKDYEIVRVPR